MRESQATEQCTQDAMDPRRLGRNNSGLSEEDVSDVICVLHPASPLAFRIAAHTARTNPQHILQNHDIALLDDGSDLASASQAQTIIVKSMSAANEPAPDLALRFSSRVCDPAVGFRFGRNTVRCDINLDPESNQRRVSNIHFRIYFNDNGALMLEDTSTNGTVVDSCSLGTKRNQENPASRTLFSGSIIEILAPAQEEVIKFILRVPARDAYEDEYIANFQKYMSHIAVVKARAEAMQQNVPIPEAAIRGMIAAPLTGPPNSKVIPMSAAVPTTSTSGSPMSWDGGGQYRCVGLLGKGAFAIVYQVATTFTGECFAAKEFEKRRFVKNGTLDSRIENEMQIMKGLRHPNIAQFVDYVETKNHMYIIMEYVAGGDLQGYMQSHGTLPEDLARPMSQQVLSALKYLHERNITHRDIKPDNILISSEHSFTVKLTDFGLSKVVKNNETFLKTFCGTLLYCAPEVFPHYDNYVANRRPKRRRPQGYEPQSKHHSYSQLVDIWSYAAVLWTTLCGKPPFEGVVDANGKGMFEKIMETPLDTSPLREQGVSELAIDLLLRMLHTNPATRPSEAECIRHPWLNDGSVPPLDHEDVVEGKSHLGSVQEEDEGLDASQLSLHDDSDDPGNDSHDETVPHNSAGPATIRQSKRVKSRRGNDSRSVSVPLVHDLDQKGQGRQTASKPPKLFGEISQSAMKSSAALPHNARTQDDDEDVQIFTGHASDEDLGAKSEGLHGHTTSARSLLGAESMVRELNMGHSGDTTPKTPSGSGNPSRDTMDEHSRHRRTPSKKHTPDQHRRSAPSDPDITPKPKFNRRIEMPITASFFYDPYDKSTHNPEYASRVSGLKFIDETTQHYLPAPGDSLPETVAPSFNSAHAGTYQDNKENEQYASSHNTSVHSPNELLRLEPQQEPQAAPGQSDVPIIEPTYSTSTSPATRPQSQASTSQPKTDTTGVFLKPAPRLGRLITTSDSFTTLVLPLEQRVTTWGRLPSLTHPYKDTTDTRIPKVALEIWFHGSGVEEADKAGADWTKTSGLSVIVRTRAKAGLRVNGVHLKECDEDGKMQYGLLREGDEIVICEKVKPETGMRERLAFTCEGFVGAAGGGKRSKEEPKFVVETTNLKVGDQK